MNIFYHGDQMDVFRTRHTTLQLLCCSLIVTVSASRAIAQTATPAPRSDTRGFVFGAHLLGNKLASPYTRAENDLASGAMVGYGITRQIMLYAGVDAGSGSTVAYEQPQNLEGDDLLRPLGASIRYEPGTVQPFLTGRTSTLHVDVGARYSYAAPTRAWIPFVDVAATNRRVTTHAYGRVFHSSGMATTIGTGLQYFIDSRFALEGAVHFATGKYNKQESTDFKETFDRVFKTETTRFSGGVRYYPHIRRQ
ncbi:MAG: hypothetical protein ABI852_00630 [Gemmatimonadaceae bacterium]